MTARIIAVEPFTLVIFGATGDLAARKLLPALFQRDRDGQIPPEATIIGVARRDLDDAAWQATVRDTLRSQRDADPNGAADEATLARFLQRLRYVATDLAGEWGWDSLKATVEAHDGRVRVFYLSTGPDLFAPICERLHRWGLATERSRVVVEKPVGKDLASAQRVNDAIGAVFAEEQVYRIDHYLGKETVQNLMALRFANALLEPIWNNGHVDHVQITVAETLGVESRAGYYDTAGALRDMVQNHLLQLLCLVAMEAPTSLDADPVRDEKLKVLKALTPFTEAGVAHSTVRGQYRAGAADGSAVPAYLDEVGRADSRTETFVALKAQIANWRWAGVPFYLRTGKRLPMRHSDIVIAFRPIPHSVFAPSAGPIHANRLVIRLQPDEGVKLWLMIKDPGPGGMRLTHVPLDMSFAKAFGVRNPDAYERLLMDVVRGNQTLFMRKDEVEAAWRWIDPIRDAWDAAAEPPKPYTAGSWGPSASIALIERDGRTWHDDLA